MSYFKTDNANPDNNNSFNAAAYDYDIGKIIISTKNAGISGEALRRTLSEKYHLELEMSGPTYALAMTSFMDEQCGFDHLAEALLEIDKNITGESPLAPICDINNAVISSDQETISDSQMEISSENLYRPQEKCLEIHEALEMPHESVPLAEAEDRICADYICLYPPGIPILAPGERIDAQTIKKIFQCIGQGLNVQGIVEEKISVL